MDVDQPPQASDQPPLASSSNDAHLEDLSSVLEQLETYPDNVTLIKKQVALMTKIQMIPEVLDATMRLSSLVMLSEGMVNKTINTHVRRMARVSRSAYPRCVLPIVSRWLCRHTGTLRTSRAGLFM